MTENPPKDQAPTDAKQVLRTVQEIKRSGRFFYLFDKAIMRRNDFMQRWKMSKVLCIVLALAVSAGLLLVGCGSQKTETAPSEAVVTDAAESAPAEEVKEPEAKPVTLSLAVFSTDQQAAFDKLNLVDLYKQAKPNVTIEIEKFKDSTDFENAFKIRKAANELPDVFGLKPYQLAMYKDTLLALDDLDAAKVNLYASAYAMDGKVYGLPDESFNEFVYYSKSIYKEYNLSIPKTWGQFVDNAKKIKEGGKYIPILLGQKDDWVNYPFTEFMGPDIANDGFFWNTIATQDEPFSKGQPFYQAFEQFKMLVDAKVFGSDPLGAGYDQVKTMLLPKKGAMLVSGAWELADLKDQATKAGTDLSDVGSFFMPVRMNESDPFRTVTMVDMFIATPKDNANVEESKAFINWFFSKDFYEPYITARGLISTVKDINVAVDPILQEAYDAQPDYQAVVYDGGGADFQKLQSATMFNFKKMGQELVAGKDLDKMMADMNKAWKEARAAK
jgi:raffinose/stachyose/melibiose transport system substrate-binding protein